jgi:starvation-inducible DNA-binding protein
MHNLVDGYKVLIASNFALYLKTHNAHFNVTGMFFPQLHELFKTQYEDLFEAYDSIGENMRKLDAFTPASLTEYLRYTVIADQIEVLDATGYVNRLLLDHERMIALLNKVFKLAEAEDRQDHMNFIAERLDAHSKQRWMLKTLVNSVANAARQVDVMVKL